MQSKSRPPSTHAARVVVWDVPPAVERGESFGIKVGVKCSAGCRTDGWAVEIRDRDGETRATATIGGEPWPDTTALFWTEVELIAPDAAGLETWEARAPSDGPDVPHTEGVTPFGLRVAPTPECLLTVVAVDAVSKAPVEGAKVVVHPYRAVTDERGVAELRVPRGSYRLFVSGGKYFPFRRDGEMETDVTIRAELAVDRELSDVDIWP